MEGGRHLDLLSTVMSFYKHLNFNTTFDQVPFFRLWYITPLILMNIKNNYFQFVYTYAVLLLINKNETTNRNATHLSQYPESSLKLIGHFLLWMLCPEYASWKVLKCLHCYLVSLEPATKVFLQTDVQQYCHNKNYWVYFT